MLTSLKLLQSSPIDHTRGISTQCTNTVGPASTQIDVYQNHTVHEHCSTSEKQNMCYIRITNAINVGVFFFFFWREGGGNFSHSEIVCNSKVYFRPLMHTYYIACPLASLGSSYKSLYLVNVCLFQVSSTFVCQFVSHFISKITRCTRKVYIHFNSVADNVYKYWLPGDKAIKRSITF